MNIATPSFIIPPKNRSTLPTSVVWASSTSPYSVEDAVCIGYDGTYWVAGTDGTNIYTSTALGGSWTLNSDNPFAQNIYDVAFGNGYWIAVGERRIATATDPTSTWTERVYNVTYNFITARYCGGYWLAGTSSQRIYYSTNPEVSWGYHSTGVAGQILDIDYGDGYWVAVTNTGKIFYTDDPSADTWTVNNDRPVGYSTITGVTYSAGDGIWAICGNDGIVSTTDDPTGTWTQQTSNITSDLYGIRTDGGTPSGYVAVGNNNIITGTKNATLWTVKPNTGSIYTSLYYNNPYYVATYGNTNFKYATI